MMVDCFIWQLFESLIYKLNTAGSGQREPPRLVLEVRGTSTLQAAMPVKLKSPQLQAQVWGVHAGLT